MNSKDLPLLIVSESPDLLFSQETFIPELNDFVVFYKNNQGISGFSTVCPHFGGPLELSEDRSLLRCKWHDWRFEVASGCVTNRRVNTKSRTYRVIFSHENEKWEIYANS